MAISGLVIGVVMVIPVSATEVLAIAASVIAGLAIADDASLRAVLSYVAGTGMGVCYSAVY